MKRLIHRLQALLHDVRINLRGSHIGMTEHELQGAQIRSALQQMRGKRMP
jgi:hypothetical protein